MSKKAAQININLLPKDPFFQTSLGKTLKWALSVGRYIVIFTELVVIFSFGTRFTLDRQVTDLNESIHQKEVIIQSYGDLESQIRFLQSKIDNYQQIEQQTNIADIFPVMSEITPRDIKLEQLAIRPEGINLEGLTLSQNSFNILINNLQLSPYFKNITIDRIETSTDKEPGFRFRLRAETQAKAIVTVNEETEKEASILDRTGGL